MKSNFPEAEGKFNPNDFRDGDCHCPDPNPNEEET